VANRLASSDHRIPPPVLILAVAGLGGISFTVSLLIERTRLHEAGGSRRQGAWRFSSRQWLQAVISMTTSAAIRAPLPLSSRPVFARLACPYLGNRAFAGGRRDERPLGVLLAVSAVSMSSSGIPESSKNYQ
jgi:hypothetical protein